MFDAIVIGARAAGSSTAMLLARRGLAVLAVDRAHFPSDTLSTHQIQVPGVAALHRWGLLDDVIAAGTPATHRVRFDPGPAVVRGSFPELDGVDAMYSPRRTVLDKILVDAARAAGAEVRERFAVDELLIEDGRVTGIRGHDRGGTRFTERAAIVIGADGRHSALAKTVAPAAYNERPALTAGYYTYWHGVPVDGGEMYGRERRFIGAWPTNDGLLMTYVALPHDEFHTFRADIEGSFLRSLDLAGDLGGRVRAGSRAERFLGTADLANWFRRPFGPGWALVGDAGLATDPVTGRGISDAFRDAELLADAVADGLDGRGPLDQELAAYERARNQAAMPMYEFTMQLASFKPPAKEEELLFKALAARAEEADRFLGVITGAVPMSDFFTPQNLMRVVGLRGMTSLALSRARPRRRGARAELAAVSAR